MENHELFKYIAMRYNNEICLQVLDDIVQLAYDINKDYGSTLANDIKIYGDDTKLKIKEICDETYNKIKEIEGSTSRMKTVLAKNASESQKATIKDLLLQCVKDTPLAFPPIAAWKMTEYYNMVVQLDYAITGWEVDRINPHLAEGSRTTCTLPKFSIDPAAYGYMDRGYANDIHPFAQFIDCTVQRYNLYMKKAFTADQGYLSKRLNTTFGNMYADYNGQVIDGYHIISPQYGMVGLNPRFQVLIELPDMKLDEEKFTKKYSSSKRIMELRKKILADCDVYRRLTAFTNLEKVKYEFVAGFNYNQLMRKNKN
jgi:hypothetical protein